MKTSKFFLQAILILLPSLLMAQSGIYTITGTIGKLPVTAKAYLAYETSTGEKIDSISIINGSFKFTGMVTNPVSAALIINKNGTGIRSREINYMDIYLEPASITVISNDSLENARINGGAINADNEILKTTLSRVYKKKDAIIKSINMSGVPFENRSEKFKDSIYNKLDSLKAEEKAIRLSFIKASPNSLLSLFLLEDYDRPSPDVAVIESLFNSLSENVRSSKAGTDYAAYIVTLKKIIIGAMAPDFTMADTIGKSISLHDFKGKYILVDFWASWCGPCRGENPNVVKAYNLYKNKNFDILSVSLDQAGTKDKWLKAIHDDHLTWAQVSDLRGWKNAAAQLYNVNAIPQNFLINPDGKIVAKDLRGDDLTNKLAEILDKK